MEVVEESVTILKALADNTRLKIINFLSCGKMCVCDLTEVLELSQPNISHHLKILKNAGLISATKQGKWTNYELNEEAFKMLESNLEYIITYDSDKYDFERSNCE